MEHENHNECLRLSKKNWFIMHLTYNENGHRIHRIAVQRVRREAAAFRCTALVLHDSACEEHPPGDVMRPLSGPESAASSIPFDGLYGF